MEYSEIILAYMDKQDVSAYKLAKAIGISESTFSRWRAVPTSKMTAKILNDIADYFDVSTDYLLGRTSYKRLIDDSSTFVGFALPGMRQPTDEELGRIKEYAEMIILSNDAKR